MKILKTFEQYNNEDNSIILTYLKDILKLNLSENQKKILEWKLSNAKKIIMTPVKNIIEEYPELEKLLQLNKFKKGDCFKNAYTISTRHFQEEILYIEGEVTIYGVPIEHAWNKIGNKYFDVTLNEDKFIGECVSFVELTPEQIMTYASKTGVYGGYLTQNYIDYLKKDLPK